MAAMQYTPALAAVGVAVAGTMLAADSGLVAAETQKAEPSLAWQWPWYLDCRHSPEWRDFSEALGADPARDPFDDDIFLRAATLLIKHESHFLNYQNDRQLAFYLCSEENRTGPGEAAPGPSEGFFCYFGYVTALAYRTRLFTDKIPGALQGRDVALRLLGSLLMARGHLLDFLDSSGWPVGLAKLLLHLYPTSGPEASPGTTAFRRGLPFPAGVDDTERPPWQALQGLRAHGAWPRHGSSALEDSRPARGHGVGRRWLVAALGYHTTLLLELVSLWETVLDADVPLDIAGHVLEPGAATAKEVRRKNICRDFRAGDLCAWDMRLLDLNARHVVPARLPVADVPNPRIADPEAFMREFAEMFRVPAPSSSSWSSVPLDARLDRADLMLCTEPALLCGAVGRAFPERPIVGYFANPLTSYVPASHAQAWLREFAWLYGSSRQAPFLALASTRFLAEQMRAQAGAPVLAVRPLATYLGPPRGAPRHRANEVVILRVQSVFWNSRCIFNDLVRLNEGLLTSVYQAGGQRGLPVPGLQFRRSEELGDGASEVLATFEASVVIPYDVSQMRFYELYALTLPMLLPPREHLPMYVYRGMTTFDDFRHALPEAAEAFEAGVDGAGAVSEGLGAAARAGEAQAAPHSSYDPFDRLSWPAAAAWTDLTHWATLPHLLYCQGAADMLVRLARDDLRPTRAGMRRRQERDLVRAARFWAAALPRLLDLDLEPRPGAAV